MGAGTGCGSCSLSWARWWAGSCPGSGAVGGRPAGLRARACSGWWRRSRAGRRRWSRPGSGVLAGLLLALIAAYERLTVSVPATEVLLTRGARRLCAARARVGRLRRRQTPGDRRPRRGRAGPGEARPVAGRRWRRPSAGTVPLAGPATRSRTGSGCGWSGYRACRRAGRRCWWPGPRPWRRARARTCRACATELARLGVVVRDEKKAQYWRLAEPL